MYWHMTTYTSPAGQIIELDEDTVSDLMALSHLTRRPTNDVARDAIERARNDLVPTTKAPAMRKPGRPVKAGS